MRIDRLACNNRVNFIPYMMTATHRYRDGYFVSYARLLYYFSILDLNKQNSHEYWCNDRCNYPKIVPNSLTKNTVVHVMDNKIRWVIKYVNLVK